MPKELRDGFDIENIGWNIDLEIFDKLDYNIESEYDPNIGRFWYVIDEAKQRSEITALRNSLNASDPPCVIIDKHTISGRWVFEYAA